MIFSSLHEILNDDKETYGYADFERKLGIGAIDSVNFGAKFTDHDRDLVFNATGYGGFHAPINETPGSVFGGPLTPGDYLDGLSPPAGTLQSYWEINRGVTRDFLFDQLATTQRYFYPQQSFSVSEKTYGGYLMGNLKGDGWRGNVGRSLGADGADLGRQQSEPGRRHRERVRQLRPDQCRSRLRRHTAEREPRVRPDRRRRAAFRDGEGDGAPGLHRRHFAGEPERRSAERLDRQPG